MLTTSSGRSSARGWLHPARHSVSASSAPILKKERVKREKECVVIDMMQKKWTRQGLIRLSSSAR